MLLPNRKTSFVTLGLVLAVFNLAAVLILVARVPEAPYVDTLPGRQAQTIQTEGLKAFGTSKLTAGRLSETATVTAYSELDSCHNKTKAGDCITASGHVLQSKDAWQLAACPRKYPLGTLVEFWTGQEPLYLTCVDRTARYLDGRFDVWVGYGREAHEAALDFGKKQWQLESVETFAL